MLAACASRLPTAGNWLRRPRHARAPRLGHRTGSQAPSPLPGIFSGVIGVILLAAFGFAGIATATAFLASYTAENGLSFDLSGCWRLASCRHLPRPARSPRSGASAPALARSCHPRLRQSAPPAGV